jgi:hypothetical protein
MQSIIVSVVLWALRLFVDDVVLRNHPVMKAIMEPQPLKPDPNPSMLHSNNPNKEII